MHTDAMPLEQHHSFLSLCYPLQDYSEKRCQCYYVEMPDGSLLLYPP